MLTSVILRRHWNGRAAGETVSTLGRGVMQTLVDNQIADWVTQPKIQRGRSRVERNVQNDRRAND
jgi:hypothetical protein